MLVMVFGAWLPSVPSTVVMHVPLHAVGWMLPWWHCWYVLAWYLLLMLVVMLCFGEVCNYDVHVSQYAMLSWIWFIVDMVDSYAVLSWYCWYHACIVLASCILSWLSKFAFKFNRIKLNLNNCWPSHGATISSWPVQPHLPLWKGPNWVYCRATRRCLQWGKVMGVRTLAW